MVEIEIEHFSHDHPLILKAEEMEDGSLVVCYGCEKQISGLSYGCKGCMHFLHISCAQLPQQLSHPSHSQHPPLSLCPSTTSALGRLIGCDVCLDVCIRFTYSCQLCNFDMDAKCALKMVSAQKRIKHKGHEHELMPLERAMITFTCYACGTKHEQENEDHDTLTSYFCTTCGVCISQKSASLPTTVHISLQSSTSGRNQDDLNFTLWYSTPTDIYIYPQQCKICRGFISRTCWVYYHCSVNKSNEYFVHLNCATPWTKKLLRNVMIETELDDLGLSLTDLSRKSSTNKDSVHEEGNSRGIMLPIPEIHVDTTTQYLLLVQAGEEYQRREEIQHFHHQHPLILSDDQEVLAAQVRCGLCRELILLAPFYHCNFDQCNFFLHETCAKLPNQVRHPCHLQHPLSIAEGLPESDNQLDIHRCACCFLSVAGAIMYACLDCKFFLDPKCASLPRSIKHEAHKHTLAPRLLLVLAPCSACQSFREILFLCDLCRFGLCIWCAILPRAVRHRCDDKHPFTLKYALPAREFPDEDFCEICLDEINANEWYYDCSDCDQSLHTRCIRPVDTLVPPTMDSYTAPFYHPHPVHLAPPPKRPCPCEMCGKLVFIHSYRAIHCITCDTWWHEDCYLYETRGILRFFGPITSSR